MNAKAAAVAIEIASENASARRNARALNTSVIRIQLEADGPDVDDEASNAGGVEFAAQVADLDVDDVGLRHEFEVPHILKQHCAGHDLTGAAHEILQELEFPRKQVDQLAVAPDRPLNKIHFQSADLQSSEPRVAAPAQERLDPRRQLTDFERLHQVIVAARLQPVNAFVDGRERADHQGRRGVAFAAQGLNDRKPILAMQHSIDDQHRGAAR